MNSTEASDTAAGLPPVAETTPPAWIATVRILLKPIVVLPILSLIYLCIAVPMLHKLVHDPARAARFIREDARQYRDIGQEFADGDFKMRYVEKKPHRQPLYPLLLAPPLKFAAGNMFALGMVNILIGLLTVWAIYLIVLRCFENPLVAAVTAAVGFLGNSFLMQQTSTQLMTEPLFLLIELPILYCFLLYVQKRRPLWLWLASAGAGVSYLARTNGLFILASLLGTLACWDAWCWLREKAPDKLARLGRLAGIYLIAALIGIVVTAPSWIPRVHYFGNPIFHGHIANFMWVDTYEEARSQGEQPVYTWHDYAAAHNAGDILQRWWKGFGTVCYGIPFMMSPVLQWAAMLGLVIAAATRNRRFLLLAVFCFAQLQPLIWTSLANSSKRVAYPGVVCFEWLFAALALAWIADQVMKRFALPRPI